MSPETGLRASLGTAEGCPRRTPCRLPACLCFAVALRIHLNPCAGGAQDSHAKTFYHPAVAGGLFAELLHRIEVNTLENRENPTTLEMNDIARVRLRLQQPLFIDAYAENRTTGSFIVIDETTLATVGGGVVI